MAPTCVPDTFVMVTQRQDNAGAIPGQPNVQGRKFNSPRFDGCKFFIQLFAFLAEIGGVERNSFHDFQQGIDFSFDGKKLIDDDYFLLAQDAVSGFEISFFISQHVIRLGNQIFQFREELVGVLDHDQVGISGKMHLNLSIFNVIFSVPPAALKSGSFLIFEGASQKSDRYCWAHGGGENRIVGCFGYAPSRANCFCRLQTNVPGNGHWDS